MVCLLDIRTSPRTGVASWRREGGRSRPTGTVGGRMAMQALGGAIGAGATPDAAKTLQRLPFRPWSDAMGDSRRRLGGAGLCRRLADSGSGRMRPVRLRSTAFAVMASRWPPRCRRRCASAAARPLQWTGRGLLPRGPLWPLRRMSSDCNGRFGPLAARRASPTTAKLPMSWDQTKRPKIGGCPPRQTFRSIVRSALTR